MADFDSFSTVPPENDAEEDPAAAFLAQEREQFAGLEEDLPNGEMSDHGFGGDTNTYNDQFVSDDYYGQVPSDDFEPVPNQQEEQPYADSINGLDDVVPASNGGDAYSAISQVDQVRKEPEKIKKWREEQKTRLEEKDAEAEVKKGEWREAAKKELEDWYKNRKDQFVKTKETNRAHEAAFIQERDEMVPGHEWEHVCRLCDFNPKNSKHSKDVSRLRSVLLQLKQTPLQR